MIPAAITSFSQPIPFSPLQLKPSSTIINGHLLPPFSQPNYPSVQYHSPLQRMTKFSLPYHYPPPPHVSPLPFNTTLQSHSISSHSPYPKPSFFIQPASSPSNSYEPSVAQPQFPDPAHVYRPRKSLKIFRGSVAMAAKSRVIKKTRKSDLPCGVSKSSRFNMNAKRVVWATTTKISGVYPAIIDEICPQVTEELTDDRTVCDSELKHESENGACLRLVRHSHNFPDDKEAMFIKLEDRGWLVNDRFVDKLPFDTQQLAMAFGKTLSLGSSIAFEQYGTCNGASVDESMKIDYKMGWEKSQKTEKFLSLIDKGNQNLVRVELYISYLEQVKTRRTDAMLPGVICFGLTNHDYDHELYINGPCLLLLCPPVASSGVVVFQDMINTLASKGNNRTCYFRTIYLEDTVKTTKLCERTHVIDFIVGSGSYDVTCRCSYSFCWKSTGLKPHKEYADTNSPFTLVDVGLSWSVLWKYTCVLKIEVDEIPGD